MYDFFKIFGQLKGLYATYTIVIV